MSRLLLTLICTPRAPRLCGFAHALLNLPLFLDSDFNPCHRNEAKLPSQPWVSLVSQPLEESDKSDESVKPWTLHRLANPCEAKSIGQV